MKKLNLNTIRIDGGTQSRVEINNATVAEYAQDVKDGIEFPAVIVFHDGADHWLADGFHRYHAHKQAGKASILADIRTGTMREAILHSLGANGAHGLRRTNADKRKAVAAMLADAEWSEWSDRKIAEACGVSQPFVSGMRKPPEVITVITPSAKKDAADRNPITPAPAAAPAAAPRAAAPATTPPPAAEPEYFGPSAEELAEAERDQEAEMAAFRLLVDADDKLAVAVAEVKRLTHMVGVLESRVEGLMNEKNAALQAAKSWQRKAEKAERALKESA